MCHHQTKTCKGALSHRNATLGLSSAVTNTEPNQARRSNYQAHEGPVTQGSAPPDWHTAPFCPHFGLCPTLLSVQRGELCSTQYVNEPRWAGAPI